MKEKLRLDKEGYEKFLLEIERVEKELSGIRKYKGEDAIFQGDNWHDNPTLYQAEMVERNLMLRINEMKQQLLEVEIVEKQYQDNSIVDIGDVVKVTMLFGTEEDDEVLKLVGGSADFSTDISEISINSPLGASIYGKTIGTKVSYKVNEREISAIIKEKLDLSMNQEDMPKSLKR